MVSRAVSLGFAMLLCVVSPSAFATGAPHAVARQPSLDDSERDALAAGYVVSRPVRFARGVDGYYVGGVSYQVVKATPTEVMAALVNVDTLPSMLPRTKRANLIDSSGERARIELVQGGGMFEASYTVHVERSAAHDELRFWMDGSRPHDVKDVWGYFRVRPFGPEHTLVTVAAVLDLGPGIVRMLFEDSIQRMILAAPYNIKSYIEPRALASAR